MKKSTWLAAIILLSVSISTGARAALMSFTGDTGGSWHDVGNWLSDGNPAVAEPTSGDNVALNGKIVHITQTAALNNFTTSGTVEIDNGGNLTGFGGYTLRYISTINVNNGGIFNMPAANMRTNVNVNQGGTASGSINIPQAEGRTLTVNGTWSPRGTTLASGTGYSVGVSSTAGYWGRVIMQSAGSINLDVYGNGSNEHFNVNGLTTSSGLTLNTGTVQLRLQGGYAPEQGHTFDLWNLAEGSLAQMLIGDGSNISMPGLGGGLSLDVSLFETTGVVSVIPEPGTLGLVAGMGVLLALRRRLHA